MAEVSFFRQDPAAERKRAYYQMLMAQAAQPKPTEVVSGVAVRQSPLEGLSRALQQGLAGYQMNQLDQKEKQRQQGARSAIMGAMDAYNRSQLGGTTDLGGEQINWNKSTPDQAQAMFQRALMANPDTAEYGMQSAMSDMAARQNAARELEMMKARFPMELEMARQKASVTRDPRGGDTGALLDRIVEAGKQTDPNFGFIDALEALKGGAGRRGALAAEIAQGREAEYEKKTGANISELEYAPQIKQQESKMGEIGKQEGEAAAKLQAMEAQYPNLINVTNQLSELGKKATYTKAGQARDILQREAGLPVGEGAIARSEYISKVDNEILPLLRQTFGAQFTEREGQALRATLGDPNKSPQEKDAVLRSFIAQKASEIESLKRQTGATESQYQEGMIADGPQGSLIFRNGRWEPYGR